MLIERHYIKASQAMPAHAVKSVVMWMNEDMEVYPILLCKIHESLVAPLTDHWRHCRCLLKHHQ